MATDNQKHQERRIEFDSKTVEFSSERRHDHHPTKPHHHEGILKNHLRPVTIQSAFSSFPLLMIPISLQQLA